MMDDIEATLEDRGDIVVETAEVRSGKPARFWAVPQ
jgi:hypothetical protein